MQLGSYLFQKVGNIEPLVDAASGSIHLFMPQSRYRNIQNLSLHSYGEGPYCKFKISAKHKTSGVYCIVSASRPLYIGECKNLTQRYNMGYGNISPKNCFQGGQQTNCRINHLIYQLTTKDHLVELWFYETSQYKQVEAELRSLYRPEWNRV